MKYAKKIYVVKIKDSDSTYLIAEENVEGLNHDGKVAIYELKEIKTKTTKVELS